VNIIAKIVSDGKEMIEKIIKNSNIFDGFLERARGLMEESDRWFKS